jgi:hypothetical protein
MRDCFGHTPLDLATAAAVADDRPTPEFVDVIDTLLRHGAERSFDGPLYSVGGRVGIDQLGSLIASTGGGDGNTFCAGGVGGATPVEVNSNADLLKRGENSNWNDSGLACKFSSTVGVTKSGIQLQEAVINKSTLPPIFKTYSPVKMALIDMLRTASCEQMIAPVRFDFATWLDAGPEAFVLKVTSLDMTDWLYKQTHSAWSLRELCRGAIRRTLGYRAHEKVRVLPLPTSIQNYLNMNELEEINTKDISIRSTVSYEDIDME